MLCFPQNFSRLSYHPCFLSFYFLYLYPFFFKQDTEQTLSSVDEDRKMYLQVSRYIHGSFTSFVWTVGLFTLKP